MQKWKIFIRKEALNMLFRFKNEICLTDEEIENCKMEILKTIKLELPEKALTSEIIMHVLKETIDYIESIPLDL